MGLFIVVRGLLNLNLVMVEGEHSGTHYEQFTTYLAGKMDCIPMDLPFERLVQEWPFSQFCGMVFNLFVFENLEKILGEEIQKFLAAI